MKRPTFGNLLGSLCGTALAAALITSCAPRQNMLTEEEIADGWELLFDGKSLDQWKDFNGDSLTQPWHVVDGCIQANGDGSDLSGYIVTRKQYENFILDWEWKLSRGGNSGMLYHVVEGPCFEVPYVTGPEYQLIDEEGWEEQNAPTKLEEWQRLGVDYAMHLPDRAAMRLNPQGEWNSSRIVFDNGHVEHWLNGVKILEFEAWTDDWFARKASGKWETAPEYGLARRGVICLQDHGYPASFRNLKIKELPRKAGSEVSLFNGRDLTGWEAYGTEKWYVDPQGLLVCESGPDKQYGYLATRAYYDDFDLTVEFRQLANGNSGIFFRSFIEPPVKVHGWQCEVAPRGNDTGGIYESYGRGWLVQIPDEKESLLKERDWNTLRLRVEGDHVQTWLNGEAMADLHDAKIGAAQGRIALQIHDGGGIKVQWRNLRLKTLCSPKSNRKQIESHGNQPQKLPENGGCRHALHHRPAVGAGRTRTHRPERPAHQGHHRRRRHRPQQLPLHQHTRMPAGGHLRRGQRPPPERRGAGPAQVRPDAENLPLLPRPDHRPECRSRTSPPRPTGTASWPSRLPRPARTSGARNP